MSSRERRPPVRTEKFILGLIVFLLMFMCVLTAYLYNQFNRNIQTTRPTSTLAAVLQLNQQEPTAAPSPTQIIWPSATPQPSTTPRPVLGDVDSLLARMSLEQQVGQMILGVVPAKTASGAGERLVRENYLGGFVLFSANITDAQQTARLAEDLQAQAARNNLDIPLFIALDGEGGRANPFHTGTTELPYLMTIGATGSTELAYQTAAVSARELRAMGINLTFRPVVDINVEPENPVINLRSFGSSTTQVTELSSAFIAGLQENGLIAVAKHFPGHGDTRVDSHADIPVINQSRAELWERDLIPFEQSIKHQVGGIMVGHIANPEIDPQGIPTTLSKPLLNDLLREEMGFDGVIFSDALMMGAITRHYGLEDAVLRSVEAGCDVIMLTNPNEAANAQQWILAAVNNGRISPERIEASVRRILTLKAQYDLLSFPLPEAPPIAENADTALADEIARKAIYVQGADTYPLLQPGRIMVFSPDLLHPGSTTGDQLSLLGELLAEQGFIVDEWIYDWDNPQQTDEIQAQAFGSLEGTDAILVITMNAHLRLAHQMDGSQERLIQAARLSGLTVVVAAVESPYDLRFVPPDVPALATFGAQAAQIKALVAALLSETAPPGVLPVRLE